MDDPPAPDDIVSASSRPPGMSTRSTGLSSWVSLPHGRLTRSTAGASVPNVTQASVSGPFSRTYADPDAGSNSAPVGTPAGRGSPIGVGGKALVSNRRMAPKPWSPWTSGAWPCAETRSRSRVGSTATNVG